MFWKRIDPKESPSNGFSRARNSGISPKRVRQSSALFCWTGMLSLFIFLSLTTVIHANANNLINNADFEHITGKSPSGWQVESWTRGFSSGVTPENVYRGKYAVYLSSIKENDVRYVQTVSVHPNTTYRLSGWVTARNIPSGTLGANLSVIGTFAHSTGISGTHRWTFQSLLFRTGPEQHEVTVAARLGFYSDTTTGTAYFDDLKLEKVTRIGGAETVQVLERPSSGLLTPGHSDSNFLWPILISLFYLLLLGAMRWSYKPIIDCFSEKTFVKQNKIPGFLILTGCFALILREPLLMKAPFPSDLACFENWALRMAQVGPVHFFQSGFFCDYPPFGLIVLWPVGWIAKLFSWPAGNPWFHALVKAPGIICDLGTAGLIYALIRKRSSLWAQVIGIIYLFLPAILYNSAYWGQVDAYYTFLMLLAFYVLVEKDAPEFAAVFVTLSFLTKAQTLAFLPLLFVVLWIKYPWQRVLRTLLFALFCFVLVVLPFGIGKPVTWIISHYSRQAALYPYASLNAANFFALIGGNGVADSTPGILGIPYNLLGICLFFGFMVWVCRFYFIKRTSGSLAAGMALSAFAFFLFFPRMHERYLFPALAFLLITLGYFRDQKIFFATIVLSISYLFNLHGVVQKYGNLLDVSTFNRIIYILAIINTTVFIGLMIVFHAKISRKGPRIKLFLRHFSREIRDNLLRKEEIRPFRTERRDYWMAGILILTYGILLFVNLGSWHTPQTGIDFKKPADGIEIRFKRQVTISSIAIYDAEGTGSLRVEYRQNGNWQTAAVLSCDDFYVLKREPAILSGVDRVRLIPQPAAGKINEVAFLNAVNRLIPVKSVMRLQDNRTVPAGRHPLFDEQSRVIKKPSWLNSTYFDEIYHGRTAYEFVSGNPVYETTHPPLGKDILAVGILLFGMNPFGMRFMHAIAGLLFIIALFLTGREVLKTRFGAYALMILGMLDFMPFVQSRYATIDSTSVLFMTLMFFFTFRFLRLETERVDTKRIFICLLGIVFFFALAAGTKWTAVYGFGGVLFVIATTIIYQYRKYGLASGATMDWSNTKTADLIKKSAGNRLFKLLTMFAVLFLIVVPLVYFLTYLPFLNAEGVSKPFSMEGIQTVIKSQVDMYQYHSQLKATHPFSSSWWSWPFDFKPLWLYMDRYPPDGLKGSIVSLGNPLIWLWGALGAFLLLYCMITGLNSRLLFNIFICFFAIYLPWSLISRVTFIYHFYPDLPLFFIFSVLILEPLWTMNRGQYRRVVIGFMAVGLFLFLAYYPVLTGADAPQWYIDNYLRWFPRDWIF